MVDNAKFQIGEAQLVSLFVASIIYGVYLVTAGQCFYAILRGGSAERAARRQWSLLVVAASMLVIATVDVAFSFRSVLDAFIFYKGSGGPNAAFESRAYLPVHAIKVRLPPPHSFRLSRLLPHSLQIIDNSIMILIGDGMLVRILLPISSI